MYDDTIAAIATAPGDAGVAVVRISGPRSAEVLGRIFEAQGNVGLAPRRLVYGTVVHPRGGERLDQALAVLMPGPGSFTGEDVAEVHCHGGQESPRRTLEASLEAGARLAEPGEFTLRAFLNGRLDLAQAEAVLDLVQARTERAHQVALEGLSGRLSEAIQAVRSELMAPRAYLEASIDFSEEDLPPEDVRPALEAALRRVRDLLEEAERGLVYRQGVRVAIVGRPNVGKSSLLNALLRADRAIVSELPGTTRDTVEETANLRGVAFHLVDTAGLRQSDDTIEQLGVARSRAALEAADLILLVLDGSGPLDVQDRVLIESCADRRTVIALNKSDLPGALDRTDLQQSAGALRCLSISALRGDGMAALEHELEAMALDGTQAGDPVVANPRHKAVLSRVEQSLVNALTALDLGMPTDLQAAEVAAAVHALGEITGENATEDLLDAIFSKFCIGK